ncbi:MAG: TraR/DksA family transcriptional regulator [Acidimicrobiales bacterium]
MTTKKTAKKASKKSPAKKAPAKKKAAATKPAAKKAPAKKKAVAKKAPAKKATAKKAPAKKAVAKKAPAKKAAAKKAPAKKATGPKADRVIKTTSAKKAAGSTKKAASKKKAAAPVAKAPARRRKTAEAPKNAGVKPAYLKDKKWLAARQDQLQQEKLELAEQVEEFRAQLDLLLETAEAGDDTSSDESSEGTSINVQISELVAERKGRLEHIEMIDEAVARISDGTYGFCYVDNVAIPKARLEARPESERCVDHKTSMFDNSRR